MNIRGFIWREEIIDKLDWKHNITLDEVEEVFKGNPPKFLIGRLTVKISLKVSKAQRKKKGNLESSSLGGKRRNRQALIVTAREMNRKERKYYGK